MAYKCTVCKYSDKGDVTLEKCSKCSKYNTCTKKVIDRPKPEMEDEEMEDEEPENDMLLE